LSKWPMAAWILMLAVISDRLKTVRSRDFTMKDIVHLHPSTTPHPGGFKCFTCQDAADNYECNRWAPDVYCPKETRYCYTLHTMDDGGGSVSVTKRCAAPEHCRFAGCAARNGFQVCTSCCEGNICNVGVPRNDSGAAFATSSRVSSGAALRPAALLYVFVVTEEVRRCLF
uniref:LY6/PLAUR domain containing 6 n=2 Tax=Kryptolebias marmoratus TaxID=37003 RepID=A0A3Q3ANY8_KRYMA